MMNQGFKKALPAGLPGARAAAAGLLLLLYPAAAGNISIKAVSALGLFYALHRLLLCLKAGLSGYGRVLALACAGFVLSLLFFLRPILFWASALVIVGAVLVLYGILRIPMIGETWALGLRFRLTALAWAAVPVLAGLPVLCHPLAAALLLLRLAGALLLILGLAELLLSEPEQP